MDPREDEEMAPQLSLDAWLRRRSVGGGDVRIHDSAQAGELVRRLGARAFTAGKDIYLSPALVNPLMREGASVLAHELYHVREQTGPDATGRPLARNGSMTQPKNQGAGRQSPAQMIQRQAQAGSTLALQRAESGSPSSEAAAEQVEDSTRRDEGAKRKKSPPDPELVAEKVYNLMSRELKFDSERKSFDW